MTTPLTHTLPQGLRVDVALAQKVESKPTVFTFTYRLDTRMFEQWLRENPHLTEGALSFVGRGIEITVPPGDKKVEKSGFAIDGPDGERIWLPLLDKAVTFVVHRDVLSGQDWVCSYVDQE